MNRIAAVLIPFLALASCHKLYSFAPSDTQLDAGPNDDSYLYDLSSDSEAGACPENKRDLSCSPQSCANVECKPVVLHSHCPCQCYGPSADDKDCDGILDICDPSSACNRLLHSASFLSSELGNNWVLDTDCLDMCSGQVSFGLCQTTEVQLAKATISGNPYRFVEVRLWPYPASVFRFEDGNIACTITHVPQDGSFSLDLEVNSDSDNRWGFVPDLDAGGKPMLILQLWSNSKEAACRLVDAISNTIGPVARVPTGESGGAMRFFSDSPVTVDYVRVYALE